ncbi:hypothetical protein M409DRAFT_62081 [Zasmidium cellare ATCC 36951]|uniref:NAD(P)-binding protein n=1 Tax=Zasmidium cellare ATCC 36951 TaxID=1080233 RepID=A0A6A6D676_ZASCE|nr:uncharacterized protein M409DRAFT_62081 [Zasmidium cellare ATCC 36951]KAF2173840.1 hypothetical protein M409DRAFT_62081 [Zasmidium cellare ATCC 36951]
MSFNPQKDIPSLAGKTIIVTGGSSGLGKETVLQLAKHNPHQIILTARTQQRGDAAIQEIEREVPASKGKLQFLQLDLGSLKSVKAAAETFGRDHDRLDVLVNNAGLMNLPPGLTEDGYEVQFGSNYMGPALFTKLLLPTLQSTASQPDSDVRIVNLSSELFKQAPSEGVLIPKLKTPLTEINSIARYGQTKLADYYHTKSLAEKYPNITSVAVHPGLVNTGILEDWKKRSPWLGWLVGSLATVVAVDVQKGARAQLWAATGSGVRSGALYKPSLKEYTEKALKDDAQAKRLWEWTEREFEQLGY